MAVNRFDPNCVVPKMSTVSVGTNAVQLKTSSTLSVKFTVTNPSTIAVYIGGASVSSSVYTVKLTSGSCVTFGPEELVGGRQKMSYDLSGVYIIASASSQTAILTIYSKGGGNGPF